MDKQDTRFEDRYDLRILKRRGDERFYELEDSVKMVFEDAIKKFENANDFRIISNARFRTTSHSEFEIDILLLYKENILATVEVKKDFNRFTEAMRRMYRHNCNILNAKYSFLCNDKIFEFLDNQGYSEIHPQRFELSADDLYSVLFKIVSVKNTFKTPTMDDISKNIIQIITESRIDENTKKKLFDIISKCKITFDNNTFLTDPPSERKFFIELLGHIPSNICRYTSLSSIFRSLNDREQSMCSIICMNDKSEIQYAAEKIEYEDLSRQYDANNCYILSCTNKSKKDDLTMWRLYGDDGKGVCLDYEIVKPFMESHSAFAIAPISYADDSGYDCRLDLIRSLLHENFNGSKLKLNEWNIWQHFFKPYEYRNEEEIRLLFWTDCSPNENGDYGEVQGIHPGFKRKWILDSTFGVIAPIVCFEIRDDDTSNFPLRLKSIMIGPKNKEKEQNCTQVNVMAIARKLISTATTDFSTVSSIKHYR